MFTSLRGENSLACCCMSQMTNEVDHQVILFDNIRVTNVDEHKHLGITLDFHFMEHFHSNIDSREYRINYSFNCDSSDIVYLLECAVCGVQYVGSTCTPFRLRFNNYKACSRKFNSGASEGHHGFLKDSCVKIIDRLTGEIGCGKASGNLI